MTTLGVITALALGFLFIFYIKKYKNSSVFTEFEDGASKLDTTDFNKMVNEWNSLRSITKESWSIDVNRKHVDCHDKMKLIQRTFVAMHFTSELMQKIDGPDSITNITSSIADTDLRKLLCKYDDLALICLWSRIIKRIANDCNEILNTMHTTESEYFQALSNDDAIENDYRIAEVVIPTLAAIYEKIITDELGKPFNIYIAAVLRQHFAIFLRRHVAKEYGMDRELKDAEILIKNYGNGPDSIMNIYFTNEPDDLFYIENMYNSGGCPKSGALINILSEFVKSQKDNIHTTILTGA